jgi:hypothetical protein
VTRGDAPSNPPINYRDKTVVLIALQARQKAFIGIMATVAATAFIWDLDIHSHAVFSGFQIPPIHILHFYLSANHPAVTHTTHHVRGDAP